MTKVSYVITVNGIDAPATATSDYNKVTEMVRVLNEDKGRTVFGFRTILTPFDPDITPEKIKASQALARKRMTAILNKKALT